MISSLPQVVGLFCLVLLSAFFSSAEISLSAASKTRLMALSEDGDRRAAMVLEMREHPGQFFSALQIGLNATALLGGIVGDAAFSPFFQWLLAEILPGQDWGRISFVISFLIATTLFVIFADLLPKRLAIARPEAVAMFVVRPMHCIITLFKPCVFILERLSDACIRSLGVPTKRQEAITSEDILASIGAGTAAGVIAPQEEAVIQNVFEMESRLVPSAMTARESIVYFTLDETEASIRARLVRSPTTASSSATKTLITSSALWIPNIYSVASWRKSPLPSKIQSSCKACSSFRTHLRSQKCLTPSNARTQTLRSFLTNTRSWSALSPSMTSCPQ